MTLDNMELVLTGETRAYEKALMGLKDRVNKSLPELCNQHGYFVALNAMKATPKATAAKIIACLRANVGGSHLTKPRKGSDKKPHAVIRFYQAEASTPWLYKKINRARGKKGKKGLYGEKMRSAVSGFVNSRINAIGTLKGGFVRLLQILAPFTRYGGFIPSGLPVPRSSGRGSATPARGGLYTPQTILEYTLNSKSGSHPIGIYPAVQDAFRTAMNAETLEMVKHLDLIIDAEIKRADRGF